MPPPRFTPIAGRAVVLGASIAGLLAARVLQERFAEVCVLERDALPDAAQSRKGTPQALHAHGLLGRGLEILEGLFPGFTAALQAQGGVVADLQAGGPFVASGRRFARRTCGRSALACSRPAIEAEVRRRVLALPRVRLVENVDVVQPLLDGTRVAAARMVGRSGGQDELLAADLVIDCTGRGSRAPVWLHAWGYDAPVEERVPVDIAYATLHLRREADAAPAPADLAGLAALVFVATAEQPRAGVMLAQEPVGDGPARWVVTLAGYGGDHPEPTLDGMRRRARAMGDAALVRVLERGEPLGPVTTFGFPHSQRRRFERLARWPRGFLVMGDALASFNPVYGQGMSVAACEALALRAALARGLDGVHRRFFAAAARIVEGPWRTAVGGDLALPGVPGARSRALRFVNGYLARVLRAAPHDGRVALAFTEVAHLLAAPASLFAPHIAARVLWHSRATAAPATVAGSAR